MSMALPSREQMAFAQDISRLLNDPIPEGIDKYELSDWIAERLAAYKEKEQINRGLALKAAKKNVKILDMAKTYGYHPVRVGRQWSLQEHDSFRIDDETNVYVQNSNQENAGSVVDFIAWAERISTKEAIDKLLSLDAGQLAADLELRYPSQSARGKEKVELELPRKNPTHKEVYAYLTLTRKISGEIVNEMLKAGAIYQDINGNVVFVSRKKNKAVYASYRTTVSRSRFMGDCRGCDYGWGWFYSYDSSALVITEGVIDALSLMTITMQEGGNYKGYDYLALGGVSKLESVLTHLQSRRYESVYIALDNDRAGNLAVSQIISLINSNLSGISIRVMAPPREQGKDWNDVLKARELNKVKLGL